ncbi:MAG: tetratricopeptide repeat protein, partial [Psychrosphaera sp.]|nr:tetratricopeptide repeat protein [Psychrosphaera sp.]
NTPYIGSWAKNYVRILKRINTEPGSQDKTKVIALLIQFNTLEVEAIREAAFIKTAADAQIAPEKQAFDAYLVGVLKDLNGKENEALRYYQQAVELMPNIPRFLNSAAHSASNNKNYHLSAAYLQRALIIASKPGGNKRGAVLYRNNLSTLWFDLGEYKKAVEFAEQALTTAGDLDKQDKTVIVSIYHRLADAWEALKKYHKALFYLEKIRQKNIENYGLGHQEAELFHDSLGRVRGLLGDWTKAIEHYQLALKSAIKTYGKGHEFVANTHMNLGKAFEALPDYPSATQHYSTALVIYEALFDANDPAIITAKAKLNDMRALSRRKRG